jgi:hypothetical protein
LGSALSSCDSRAARRRAAKGPRCCDSMQWTMLRGGGAGRGGRADAGGWGTDGERLGV